MEAKAEVIAECSSPLGMLKGTVTDELVTVVGNTGERGADIVTINGTDRIGTPAVCTDGLQGCLAIGITGEDEQGVRCAFFTHAAYWTEARSSQIPEDVMYWAKAFVESHKNINVSIGYNGLRPGERYLNKEMGVWKANEMQSAVMGLLGNPRAATVTITDVGYSALFNAATGVMTRYEKPKQTVERHTDESRGFIISTEAKLATGTNPKQKAKKSTKKTDDEPRKKGDCKLV